MRKLTIVLALAALAACAKKTVPEGSVKGIAKFQLGGGAAISQPDVDDYNPQVLQQGDNFLVLVFASNRSCGTCSGHNLFIARSTVAYNNDAVFPAFDNPTVMTVAGTPLNYTTPIAFTPVLSGNNVRIYLTNAGGTIQQTTAMTPGGSYDTTLSAITNTTGATNATVVGSEFTGSKLYARQNGTIYSFTQNSTDTPVAMVTGQTATSVASVDGTFTSRYDGFFSLTDGTITSMSLYGNGGNLVSVNTAIAKARLSARYVSVLRGGGFQGGLMFISGIEAGGTTQDMYVVDGMTVWQMWQLINPKPPGAPDGGGTATPTTAADPAYSPVAGHYAMPLNITITSTTSGAIVCYTTDGVTDPACDATPACTTGTTYAGAISFYNLTRTFRARACKAGLADSPVIAATHVSDGIQPTTPTAPAANATSSSQVQLTWTASTDAGTTQAQLVYEICQTTINNGCNTFTASFTSSAGATSYDSTGLSASTTYYYRIRSRDLAGNTSGYTAQLTATTSAGPAVSAPTFLPVAGTFNSAQNVTVTTATGSAILCYSTDGSTPACDATPSCTTGSLYSSAVNIPATATLRAIGCRSGYTNSTVTAGTYTIDTTAPVITGTAPASSANVSNTQVSFTFSEACASGSITWTRTGGTADGGGSPAGTHTQNLVGGELTSGAHNSITLTNNPTLVSGTIYSVSFNCTDAAGNAATTVTNTNVNYSPASSPRLWETSGTVYAMTLSGTTLYVGGTFTYVGPANGTGTAIDLSTGEIPAGVSPLKITGGSVNAVAPDGSGGWYIGGTFTQIGGVARNRIARLNSDGSLHSWNPDSSSDIYSIVVSGTTVYVGGTFTNIGGQTRNRIAALDATVNTLNATSWNPNSNNTVRTLAISGTTIYAGGEFTTIGGQTRNRIAAINTSTGLATTWNPDANNAVYTLAISGNTVYAGGTFNGIGGQVRNYIAALDTTIDANNATPWNPNASGQVYALAISGTRVYAGGTYTSIGGQSRSNLAALDSAVNTNNALSWNPAPDGSVVNAITVTGTNVYVGGDFINIGGVARDRIAAIDETTGNATSWISGANNTVYALATDGTKLYAGGIFSMSTGRSRNRVAAIDTTTGKATSWNPNSGGAVRAIVVSGSTVYLGGQFTTMGGQTRNRIAAVDATTGALANWNPNAGNTVFDMALSGTTLFAGGQFATIGGQTRQFVAALDTTVDTNNATAWSCNAVNTVFTIAVSGTTLYAGGNFTTIGGQARNRIAAISTTTGVPTSWNPNANFTVNRIVVLGSTVYAGGAFTTIGGQSRNNIAALDASTGLATTWNPNANNPVDSLAIVGSTAYIGGEFTMINGQSRSYLAAVDTTTAAVGSLSLALNGYAYALINSGSLLYTGGDFNTSNLRQFLMSIDTGTGNPN